MGLLFYYTGKILYSPLAILILQQKWVMDFDAEDTASNKRNQFKYERLADDDDDDCVADLSVSLLSSLLETMLFIDMRY